MREENYTPMHPARIIGVPRVPCKVQYFTRPSRGATCTWTVILMIMTCFPANCQHENGTTINFLALLPFEIPGAPEQPLYTDGPQMLPAAQLAVDQINSREDVLSGYTVNLTVANSACNLDTDTILNFIPTFFHTSTSFVGIVGPTCSESVELLSRITGENEVATLNFHIAGSTRLADRTKYGFTFGTAGSARGYVELFLSLVEHNDWNSIAFFYEELEVIYKVAYTQSIEKFHQRFPDRRIEISVPITEYHLPVSSLIEQRVRVIFILSSPELIRRIFCLASHISPPLKYPTYQFILYEQLSSSFQKGVNFTYNSQYFSCTRQQITASMEGTLFTHSQLELVNTSTTLVSKITYADYIEQYRERLVGAGEGNSTLDWANPIYDGVWALALALNHSVPKLQEIGLDLANYSYGQLNASKIIRNEVYKLDFQGTSGRILFNNTTGYDKAAVNLHQVIKNCSHLVGNFSEDSGKLVLADKVQFIKSNFETVELLVHPALATFFLLLTFVALVLILIMHILTLVYRNFKSMKASSYRLSQLIYTGCYVLIFSIVAFSVEKSALTTSVNKPALCTMQIWCLPISLTLIVGSVALKTWRLYRIFIKLKKPGKFMSDYSLIAAVLILVAVDVVLCLSWTVTSPFSVSKREQLSGVNEIEVTIECQSENFFAWFGVLMTLQCLLLFIALTFALMTRKIYHESFKTKAVVLLVYFLTLTLLLGFPTYFVLKFTTASSPNAVYAVLSLTLDTVLYLCLGLLFFPPVLSLLKAKIFPRVPGLNKYSTDTVVSKPVSSYIQS